MTPTSFDPGRVEVLFVGGPSGGHLYPAMALAEELVRLTGLRPRFLYGARPIERSIIEASGFDATEVPALEVNSGRSLRAAHRFLSREVDWTRVAALVATGGRASLLPAWVARRQRRPIFALEQNRVVGRAQRWLMRGATRLFLSFDDTRGPRRLDRVSLRLGCPVRSSFRPEPLPEGEPTLLVLGGSQGSRAINQLVVDTLRHPEWRASWNGWRVVHLTGHGKSESEHDATRFEAVYREAGVEAEVMEYCADPASLLARSHLVLARAGGSTIAEMSAVGRGGLFVPYPHHRDRQQFLNAAALVEVGAAQVLTEEPAALARALTDADRAALEGMARAARSIGRPDAATRIAEVIATHLERFPRTLAELERRTA